MHYVLVDSRIRLFPVCRCIAFHRSFHALAQFFQKEDTMIYRFHITLATSIEDVAIALDVEVQGNSESEAQTFLFNSLEEDLPEDTLILDCQLVSTESESEK